MADKVFRGDAVAIAQVTRIAAPTVPGAVTLTINDKSLVFSAWDIDTVVDTWNGETTVVNPVSQTEEFSDITASADGNDLILTADNEGKPFIVLASMGGTGISSEVQTVTIGNSPSGGTFTLTYAGNTTTGIAYNAAASAVQSALQALASIGAGNALVTGSNGGPYTVTFAGTLAGTNLALMTCSAASLTGGTAAITITPLADGAVAVNEQQKITLNGTPTGGTFTLSFSGQTTAGIAFNASAAAVKTALEALSSIGTGNVNTSGGALPGTTVTVTFQGTLAGVNVPLMTANPASLTGSTLSGTITTPTPGVTGQDLVVDVTLGAPYGLIPSGYLYYYVTLYHVLTSQTYTGDLPLSSESSAADVKTALVQIFFSTGVTPSADCVSVANLGAGTFRITFINALHAVNAWTNEVMWGFLNFVRAAPGADTRITTTVQVATAGTNEIQEIAIAGTPTAGTFTLTWNSQTTAPIAYNASAATVKAALEALSNIGTGGVTGGGGALPGTPVTITFSGNGLQATDVAAMTVDVTAMKAPVDLLVQGVPGIQETQRVTITGSPFAGSFTLTVGANTTTGIAYNANAATVQAALVALASVGGGNCVCSGGPLPGAPVTCVFATSLGNLALMTAGNTLHNGTVTVVETIQGGVSIVMTETTLSRGPNHWDDPGNWNPYGVPETGDVAHLESGSAPLLYGIKQRATFTADAATDVLTLSTAHKTFAEGQKIRVLNAGGALPAGLAAATDYYALNVGVGGDSFLQLSATRGGAAVNITGAGTGTQTIEVLLAELRDCLRYTGTVGLPTHTDDDNREYRPLYLEIGATLVNIGVGQGTGSGRVKIDTGTQQTAVKVYDSGGSIDSEASAFVWKGTNAANTLQVLSGDVGVALLAAELASVASIVQRGGTLELGDGVTVGSIDKTGGILTSNNADIAGVLQLQG